ncbi:MAG: YbjQ family protein [Planctomycetaceae bacterium]|nr:YbjQ family protein [Planctomycetaceae bacterium]
MQSTTNTPFERFAFAAAILLSLFAILLPILLMLCIPLELMKVIDERIGHILVYASMFIVFFIPIFCIVSAIKIEHDHIKALDKAEAEFTDIVVSDMKTLPPNWKPVKTVFIVENVVIANDYLKTFFWFFRKIVGGESKAFSKLIARARREATVRVLRKARECGANAVWNIRYETSVVQTNMSQDGTKSMAGAEVLAYATAFTVQ